jgi:hypothetical protein
MAYILVCPKDGKFLAFSPYYSKEMTDIPARVQRFANTKVAQDYLIEVGLAELEIVPEEELL